MKHLAAALCLGLLGLRPATTIAQTKAADTGPPVRYTVSFPNAAHHEARVMATFAGLPGGTLRVRMARSSPGRYSLHDFAKNVYYVVATDAANKPLALTKADPYSWDVTVGPDKTVVFSYTLYGDRTDGTYVGIDQQHAHLNLPATLCYAQGLESRAAELKLEPLPNWKIATQLRRSDANTYLAPNLDYLFDSPVSLGAQQVKSWQEGEQTIEFATLYQGPAPDLDAFVKNTQKIVREEQAIFGELPSFDYNRYTFVANYLGQATPDGMEHRNSTSLTSPFPLVAAEDGPNNLATVAHEFFHAWNVERVRPKDLEPFDYQRTNMSDHLWFAEGFTQYYGELVMRRIKAYDDETFFGKISDWVNARQNSAGARYASAVDMSRQAPFADGAASADPTNKANTYLSYYVQGAGIALALDLQLRQRYRTSLDKFMQAMWKEFGKDQDNYAPVKTYTLGDWRRVLGETCRDTAFAGRFVRQYIVGREQPRFTELLLPAGLAVVPSHVLGAALPRQVEFDDEGRCIVAVNTTIGSGLYKAGIDRGDQLVMLDGKEIKSSNELMAVMRKHSPSDIVFARVRSRGGAERNMQLVLTEDPNVQVQPVENVDKMTLDPKQKELRNAWLSSQAGQ